MDQVTYTTGQSGAESLPSGTSSTPFTVADTAAGAEEVRDYLISGLKDAHAMEGMAVTLLQTQLDRTRNYPEMKARIATHLEETKGQSGRLEKALAKLGTDHSMLKDAGLKLAANGQMLFHAMMEDEVVKNAIGSFAFENFEIASYRALITVAQLFGDEEILALCVSNLKEEEAMADWLAQHLPNTVRQYLTRKSNDQEAKR